MKQVITRMPAALHALAKDEAARRGQSLNDFITDAVVTALGDADHPPFRARAAALGLLAAPGDWTTDDLTPVQREARRREWMARQPEGAADAVFEALMADRRGEPWP
ncbi:MAG: toxin-antitoxin system HicB family antitoxin [Actinomycetota bacterium]